MWEGKGNLIGNSNYKEKLTSKLMSQRNSDKIHKEWMVFGNILGRFEENLY